MLSALAFSKQDKDEGQIPKDGQHLDIERVVDNIFENESTATGRSSENAAVTESSVLVPEDEEHSKGRENLNGKLNDEPTKRITGKQVEKISFGTHFASKGCVSDDVTMRSVKQPKGGNTEASTIMVECKFAKDDLTVKKQDADCLYPNPVKHMPKGLKGSGGLITNEHFNEVLSNVNALPVTTQLKKSTTEETMEKKPEDKDGEDVERAFFRQPVVSKEFKQWTVNMMRAEYAHTGLALPGSSPEPGMQLEWNRLTTFNQFEPPEGVYILPIANAGFYLPVGSGNKERAKVECAFCSIVVAMVDFRSKNAMEVHRRVSPRCRFVLGESVGEVAERTGGLFLDKYNPRRSIHDAQTSEPRPMAGAARLAAVTGRRDELAVDADVAPTERPDAPIMSYALPTTKAGFTSLPSAPRRTSETPRQQQTPPAPSSNAPPAQNSQPAASATAAATPSSQATGGAPFQTAIVAANASLQRDLGTAQTDAVTRNQTASAGSAQVQPPNSSSSSSSAATANQSGTATAGNGQQRQTVTYEDLGIISQKPKRPDMAVTRVRINTFNNWTHEGTHPKDQMAEAGFYFTGHEDLVRCFHCKGGLKTWESSDNPWVEHSRWFPRCPFLKLSKGQRFIDAVQKLNDPNTRPTISMEAVAREMRSLEEEEQRNLSSDVMLFRNLPPRPPVVLPNDALATAGLRIDATFTEASMTEMAERLEEENEELRENALCKICQTNEVNVLFLPCGHLVACSQCAPALTTCAMCRQPVKGSVRVNLDDDKRDSDRVMEILNGNNGPPETSG